MSAFETTFQVRFGHVDPAGVAYYPRIFDYIHEVHEDLLERHVDVRYNELILEQRIGFPLVSSQVEFRAPLRFGDHPRARVTCVHLGRSSIGLHYVFLLGDTVCVDARMTTVCTDLRTMRSVPLPERVRERLEAIREAT